MCDPIRPQGQGSCFLREQRLCDISSVVRFSVGLQNERWSQIHDRAASTRSSLASSHPPMAWAAPRNRLMGVRRQQRALVVWRPMRRAPGCQSATPGARPLGALLDSCAT